MTDRWLMSATAGLCLLLACVASLASGSPVPALVGTAAFLGVVGVFARDRT